MYKLKQEKSKVEIELTTGPQEWEQAVETVYQQNKGKYNVTGFRKGHAPRKVIEKEYGDNVFFEDTVDFFFNKTLNEVLKENPALEPVAMPTIQFESFTLQDGLKMKILFEVVPDFKLCSFKGAKIDVHSTEVSEHDIKHEIKHFLDEHSTFESVDQPAKMGDSVLIDFIGFMDGVEFEGGKAQNYPLELGSHSFIDTFEDQLVGHKKGDKVSVDVTFPKDYGASEFAGKKAVFEVTVNDVREKKVPTLDDNFISNTTEFETVEEYRKDLTAHIQTMKKSEADNEFQYNMRKYLLENTSIDIPQIMIENAVKQETEHLQQALAAYNMSMDEYLMRSGVGSFEEYTNRIREGAENSIKARYIYRKIIEENNITVSNEDVLAAAGNTEDENELVRKENELLIAKLFDFLKSQVVLEILPEEACHCC